jgi:hypothetical protein
MSTQYRLVQSGKTASGGCSAGQGSSEPVAPRIIMASGSITRNILRVLSTGLEETHGWIRVTIRNKCGGDTQVLQSPQSRKVIVDLTTLFQ